MIKDLVSILFVTTLLLSARPGFAEAAPKNIDLSKFPATQLDDIVVPLPSEVFNVLDKLGTPNWQEQLRDPKVHPARQKVLESLGDHWTGLTVFVEHPEVPMDNNTAERSERGPVVGRKNYYGSGSVGSGELAAMLFSLFQTLCLSGLNPRLWLTASLSACAKAGGRAPAEVERFLPWNLSPEKRREWGSDDAVPAADTS